MSNQKTTPQQDSHEEEKAGMSSILSRRKLLTALGMSGAALAAGGLLPTSAFAAGNGNANGIRVVAEQVVQEMVPPMMSESCVQTATVAELRAVSLPVDTLYYVTDSGQEGHFYYDPADNASADNTGAVLVSSSGARFKRIMEGEIDVRWFGAKGDGIADDSAPLMSAMIFAAQKNKKVFIPKTDFSYNIASTIRVPLDSGEELIIESNGALIKPASLFSSTTIWKLTQFDERVFLSIGKISQGTNVSTAFDNNVNTSVKISGLIVDGSVISVVPNTNGYATTIGVGIQISAENVEISHCLIQNMFGYGLRVHGPKYFTASNSKFLEVGGRGMTPHTGGDYDAFGDGLFTSSVKEGGMVSIADCDIHGISSLAKRSRSAITFEFGIHKYTSNISRCKISKYAKGFHIEENVPSFIVIDDCDLSDFNFGIANVLNNGGRCMINNSRFVVSDIDRQDFGSPLIILNMSDIGVYFCNCIIDLDCERTYQSIPYVKLFDKCSIYGHNKNHFFADASSKFTSCTFYDFGGAYFSFSHWGNTGQYFLENCDFYGGEDITASGARLEFVNCRHYAEGKRLIGTNLTAANDVFPNLNGECAVIGITGTTCQIKPDTSFSPLWGSVMRLAAIIYSHDLNPTRRFGRSVMSNLSLIGGGYRIVKFKVASSGSWVVDGAPELVGTDQSAEGFNIVTSDGGITWSKDPNGFNGQWVAGFDVVIIPVHYLTYVQ